MRLGASRFVAGETLDDCVAVLRELDRRGLRSYAILLGEGVTERARVARTVDRYRAVLDRLGDEPLSVTMSIKLTHLGLALDEELAARSAEAIVGHAAARGLFVRLDMEDSRYVDATLRIHRRLRAAGLANTGVVIQAYLHRAEADLRALIGDGDLNVRLVKGAYLEPPTVALARKADVDRNFRRLIEIALDGAAFSAIATHDEAVIAGTRPNGGAAYEYQLLYGVRPQLQQRLADAGHAVRVCVPYGSEWYVYFGRRLAERPANLLFVLRNLVRP
jgi:proline dehydrogenase